jgi:hypothetical protein
VMQQSEPIGDVGDRRLTRLRRCKLAACQV